jgi:hypothetical protein
MWHVRVTIVLTIVVLERNNKLLYFCANVAVNNIYIECNNESSLYCCVTMI